MSSLQFCDRCEVGITRSEKVFHTRDRRILCNACHGLEVQEHKAKAERHLRERRGRGGGGKQKVLVLSVAAAVVVIAGVALAFSMRKDAPPAQAAESTPVVEPPATEDG